MGSLNVIAGTSVYLDTNILIYAVEDVEGYGRRLRTLFERIDRTELRAITSELTLAELLVKPLREKDETARDVYETLLGPSGPLTIEPISRPILRKAAELRAAWPSLKMLDAIHAATSVVVGCETFLTNDAKFEVVAELPVLLATALPDELNM